MMRGLFGLFCLCALICAEGRGGRGRGGRRKWRSPQRGNAERAPSPAPKVDKFEFAQEVDADSWVEKVESMANHSLKPLYFPFVMFHVSTCQYCQATLPEFEHAAAMIDKSAQDGHLKGLPANVSFFMLRCDKSPRERKICDQHPGPGLPMLKLFRDKHELPFTGERWAKAIAEWAVHTSRHLLLNAETQKDLEKYNEAGVVFLMREKTAKDRTLLMAWLDLAYQYIEDAFFVVVPENSEVHSKLMTPGQEVVAFGKGIESLSHEGKVTAESLKKWVDINRWQVVVPLSEKNAVKLMNSGRKVVTYAFKFQRGMQLDEVDQKFKKKASEMRKSGEYIFASIDCYRKEHSSFLARMFPAVAAPSIFVFPGNITFKSQLLYWENPTLRPDGLSYDALDELMSDSWARQDSGKISTAKAWGKWSFRFGTGSALGFLVIIGLPLAVILMLWCCMKELFTADEPSLQVPRQQKSTALKEMHQKRANDAKKDVEAKKGESKDTDENKEPVKKDPNEKKDE